MSTNLLASTPMPKRIARLPRDKHGYPIPWFVIEQDDGTRDFRIAGQGLFVDAVRLKLCWVCGGAMGRHSAFVIGPMCAVNRISADPPSHRECAVYAATVCPFLATPNMRRRESGLPDGRVEAAGIMLARNPGVALVWVTAQWKVFRPFAGGDGILFEIGDPSETLWFAEGRRATRAEVRAAMDSGLPLLDEACDRDPDPAESRKVLGKQYQRALTLLPAG